MKERRTEGREYSAVCWVYCLHISNCLIGGIIYSSGTSFIWVCTTNFVWTICYAWCKCTVCQLLNSLMDELPRFSCGVSWGRCMQHCCREARVAYRVHTPTYPMGICFAENLDGSLWSSATAFELHPLWPQWNDLLSCVVEINCGYCGNVMRNSCGPHLAFAL